MHSTKQHGTHFEMLHQLHRSYYSFMLLKGIVLLEIMFKYSH
jgi:hypothetical protein